VILLSKNIVTNTDSLEN